MFADVGRSGEGTLYLILLGTMLEQPSSGRLGAPSSSSSRLAANLLTRHFLITSAKAHILLYCNGTLVGHGAKFLLVRP